jgi:hypothetical protein
MKPELAYAKQMTLRTEDWQLRFLAPKKTITTGPPASWHRCHRSNRNCSSDFTTGEDQRKGLSNTLEQDQTTKVIAATKPSFISIVVAARATMRKPRIAVHQ